MEKRFGLFVTLEDETGVVWQPVGGMSGEAGVRDCLEDLSDQVVT